MIGFEEAIRAVREVAPVPDREVVRLTEAVGRTAVEEVRVRAALPTARSAAMDGFACRAEDAVTASDASPVRLRLVDASRAGTPADRPVAAGEAVVVSTGAVVPEGADAIVVAEHAEQAGDEVIVRAPAATKHVRPVGEDLEQGAVVIERGTRLGPRGVALVASAGWDQVVVATRPAVLVIATGPELRPPTAALGPGEVPDANGPLVATALRRHGVDVEVAGPVVDDEAALRSSVADGLERMRNSGTPASLVVTTGGASIGRHDVVRRVLASEGEVIFDGIRVRPGRPAMLARWHGTPWLALPGTPHAVAVLGALLMRAWSDAAAGGDHVPFPRRPSVLDAEVRGVPHRTVLALARSRHDDAGVRQVSPLQRSSSSRMRDVARANALVVVPEGRHLAAGDVVETIDFLDG